MKMYMSKKKLRKLVKDHKICGCSAYSKVQLVDALKSKGIIPEEMVVDDKGYEYLKGVRKGNKRVEVKDLETGETKVYSSIYSCAKALKINPGTIRFFNHKQSKKL